MLMQIFVGDFFLLNRQNQEKVFLSRVIGDMMLIMIYT